MRIALIVEGKTEKAFLPALRNYLMRTLAGQMPTLKAIPQGGRVPKEDKLKRLVKNLFKDYDAVICADGCLHEQRPKQPRLYRCR